MAGRNDQIQAAIDANIRTLLAPELIAGLRMNINRPLGDGRDGTTPSRRRFGRCATANLYRHYQKRHLRGRVGHRRQSAIDGKLAVEIGVRCSLATGRRGPGHSVFSLTNGMNVTGPDSTA